MFRWQTNKSKLHASGQLKVNIQMGKLMWLGLTYIHIFISLFLSKALYNLKWNALVNNNY